MPPVQSRFLLVALLGLFVAIAATNVADVLAQTSPSSSAAAAPQTDGLKAQLANDKLELEIKKLKDELSWLTWALQLLTAFVSPLAVLYVGYVLNKRLNQLESAEVSRRQVEEREAARFSALVEDRACAYALAYAKLSPTALFFPAPDVEPGASPSEPGAPGPAELKPGTPQTAAVVAPETRSKESPQLTKEDCARMGRQLSSWYFGDGGLLMTEDSRDAYFALMEALRGAAAAPKKLAVQDVGEHPQVISLILLEGYRKTLAKKYPVFEKLEAKVPVKHADLTAWEFGPLDNHTSDAERFKDYVLIQTLASRFRTMLTEDIGSRKPPA